MSNLSMREMLSSGVHFGHRTRYWHPKMAPYIFGVRNNVHIINLEQTLPMLQDAINFVGSIASHGGKVLFVGTKHAATQIIREQAERCGMPFVNHRWLGGMLTNYKTVRRSVKRLKDLDLSFEKKSFVSLNKKEILMLSRQRDKLERSLGGIKGMAGLPDAIFVVDIGYDRIAVTEAQKLRIPVIGIVDTNHSPDGINYPVPGNDDSLRSIHLYASSLADAILDAKTAAQAVEDTSKKTVEINVKRSVEKR